MKVALLGCAPGFEAAPFGQPDWEVWGLNDLYLKLTAERLASVTRWFELHGDTPLTRSRRAADHWDKLAALTMPVYTFFSLPTVPSAIRFPQAIVDRGPNYFSCTMAYQIALALSEGATDIALFGISLTGAREALVERPCVDYWLGYAEGRGVNTSVHQESAHGYGLWHHRPYRYALDDEAERRDAYWMVRTHALTVPSWVWQEESRLQIAREAIEA